MFSCAERLGTRLNDWNTTPTVWRRYSARPALEARDVGVADVNGAGGGVRIDASIDSRVVLPHPLAPSSARLPVPMSRSKWLKGRTTVPPLEYSIVRSNPDVGHHLPPNATGIGAERAPHARDAGEDTDDDADRDELRILAAELRRERQAQPHELRHADGKDAGRDRHQHRPAAAGGRRRARRFGKPVALTAKSRIRSIADR